MPVSYTGDVTQGGPPTCGGSRGDDHQDRGGRLRQQRLPAALQPDRRRAAHRRRRRARPAPRADRRPADQHDRHHPPPPGPLDGAGGGGQGHRRPVDRPPAGRAATCRSRSLRRSSTATASRSARPTWRSSTCAGTRRARSPCSTTAAAPTSTCSPATRCSPAGSATPQGPGAVRAALHRRGRARVRPASRRDLGLPGPRQGHHARRRAPGPPRVEGPRLVDRRRGG